MIMLDPLIVKSGEQRQLGVSPKPPEYTVEHGITSGTLPA
jgi:hypothetical protein